MVTSIICPRTPGVLYIANVWPLIYSVAFSYTLTSFLCPLSDAKSLGSTSKNLHTSKASSTDNGLFRPFSPKLAYKQAYAMPVVFEIFEILIPFSLIYWANLMVAGDT